MMHRLICLWQAMEFMTKVIHISVARQTALGKTGVICGLPAIACTWFCAFQCGPFFGPFYLNPADWTN